MTSTLDSACSRTEQVFMIITSASSSFLLSVIPHSERRVSMISLSARFIWHPYVSITNEWPFNRFFTSSEYDAWWLVVGDCFYTWILTLLKTSKKSSRVLPSLGRIRLVENKEQRGLEIERPKRNREEKAARSMRNDRSQSPEKVAEKKSLRKRIYLSFDVPVSDSRVSTNTANTY